MLERHTTPPPALRTNVAEPLPQEFLSTLPPKKIAELIDMAVGKEVPITCPCSALGIDEKFFRFPVEGKVYVQFPREARHLILVRFESENIIINFT